MAKSAQTSKKFSSVDQQIEILKQKNMIFDDENNARDLLIRNNYYIVINGYRAPFLLNQGQKTKTQYIKGTTFEEIYSLYIFDRKLRLSFFDAILNVEQNLKSAVSYEFSKKYGHSDYLLPENFDTSQPGNVREVFFMIGSIHNTLSKNISKNEYISYYVDKYQFIPFWVLSNILTLGGIINFYKLMKPEEKSLISRKYFTMTPEELESYLECINHFRNVCAHDERLYNTKSSKKSISENEIHRHFNIQGTDNQQGKKDVFSLLISLVMLQSRPDYMEMIEKIENLLYKLETKLHTISIRKIEEEMGFPENWQEISNIFV